MIWFKIKINDSNHLLHSNESEIFTNVKIQVTETKSFTDL